jgi:hypothetical protein
MVQTDYKQKSILENKGILKKKTMYKHYNIKNDLKNEKIYEMKCTLHTERGLVITNIIIIIIHIIGRTNINFARKNLNKA